MKLSTIQKHALTGMHFTEYQFDGEVYSEIRYEIIGALDDEGETVWAVLANETLSNDFMVRELAPRTEIMADARMNALAGVSFDEF